jgi:hypothetical protein
LYSLNYWGLGNIEPLVALFLLSITCLIGYAEDIFKIAEDYINSNADRLRKPRKAPLNPTHRHSILLSDFLINYFTNCYYYFQFIFYNKFSRSNSEGIMDKEELEHIVYLAQAAHDAAEKAKTAYDTYVQAATALYLENAIKTVKEAYKSSSADHDFKSSISQKLQNLFNPSQEESPQNTQDLELQSSNKKNAFPNLDKTLDDLFTQED